MPTHALIELREYQLDTSIGYDAEGAALHGLHLLDLTLIIDAALVHIASDSMHAVFDYDPLMEEIKQVAKDRHYETQEFLMSRIAQVCAAHTRIRAAEICLRKAVQPSGTLGLRLGLDAQDLAALR